MEGVGPLTSALGVRSAVLPSAPAIDAGKYRAKSEAPAARPGPMSYGRSMGHARFRWPGFSVPWR